MNVEPYKVSICVPVYGVEKYIERCAHSLFKQTYGNLEFIFVDDCTKDRSIEILREVMRNYPERERQVRIIKHEHNRGLAAARNTAVEAVRSDFLMHVDSDDWIDVDAVELLVAKQVETGADYVTADMEVIRWNRRVNMMRTRYTTPHDLSLSLIKRETAVCVVGQLIRTALYSDNDIKVEEGTNVGEDFQQSCRLAYFAQKTAGVNKAIYHYDCSNEGSYMHSDFSLEKWKEGYRSAEIVMDFCQDKGNDFVQAAEYMRFVVAMDGLRDLTKSNIYKKEYTTMLEIVNSRRDLWTTQPLFLQICAHLQNIYLVAICVKSARTLYRLYFRISSFLLYGY